MARMVGNLAPFEGAEATARRVPFRVRASYDGQPVLDTTDALMLWEPRQVVPSYAVPVRDVDADLVERSHLDPPDALPPVLTPEHGFTHSVPGSLLDVEVAGTVLDGAAFRPDDPDLSDHVVLDFGRFSWLSEDEPLVGHPHDPFARIDVLASRRHVRVSLGGTLLAESSAPRLLVETSIVPRWYLPREDVRLDLLSPSDLRTTCAYKGHASYLSHEPSGDAGRDIAWTYEDPLADAEPVRSMVCFYAEATDLEVDGEPVGRPRTFWSKDEE